MIDSDKPDYDFEEISKLIHVVEKTREYPKLKKIHDAAMAKLEAHANPSEPDQGGPVDHTEESEPALRRNL